MRMKMPLRLLRRQSLNVVLIVLFASSLLFRPVNGGQDKDNLPGAFFDDFFAGNCQQAPPQHPSVTTQFWSSIMQASNRLPLERQTEYAIQLLESVPFIMPQPGVGLMSNLQFGLWQALEWNHPPLIRALLSDRRVNPSDWNNLPIRICSARGQDAAVKLLLDDNRVDPSAFNNEALLSALNGNHTVVIILLLRSGRVNVNECLLPDVFTPVIAQFNNIEVFRELILGNRYTLNSERIAYLIEMILNLNRPEILEILWPRFANQLNFADRRQLLGYACVVATSEWVWRLFSQEGMLEGSVIGLPDGGSSFVLDCLMTLIRRREIKTVARLLLRHPLVNQIMITATLSPQFISSLVHTMASPWHDRVIDSGRSTFTRAHILFWIFYGSNVCANHLREQFGESYYDAINANQKTCSLFTQWMIIELEKMEPQKAGEMLADPSTRQKLIQSKLMQYRNTAGITMKSQMLLDIGK